jgi:hypothetical protein
MLYGTFPFDGSHEYLIFEKIQKRDFKFPENSTEI